MKRADCLNFCRELLAIGVFLVLFAVCACLDSYFSTAEKVAVMGVESLALWRETVKECLWTPVVEELIFRSPVWLLLILIPPAKKSKKIIISVAVIIGMFLWIRWHELVYPLTMAVVALGFYLVLIIVYCRQPFSRRFSVKPMIFVILAHQLFNISSLFFTFLLRNH